MYVKPPFAAPTGLLGKTGLGGRAQSVARLGGGMALDGGRGVEPLLRLVDDKDGFIAGTLSSGVTTGAEVG